MQQKCEEVHRVGVSWARVTVDQCRHRHGGDGGGGRLSAKRAAVEEGRGAGKAEAGSGYGRAHLVRGRVAGRLDDVDVAVPDGIVDLHVGLRNKRRTRVREEEGQDQNATNGMSRENDVCVCVRVCDGVPLGGGGS